MASIDKRQAVTIIIGTVLVTVLGWKFLEARDGLLLNRVQAVGSLLFTFNGLAPDAAVFDEPDVKPGDCYVRNVDVTNEGAVEAAVAVKSAEEEDPDNLAAIFTILIEEGLTALYGETTVAKFFADSADLADGIPLSTVPAEGSTTYTFTVCMPPEAGNEYQDKTQVFDLVFGIVTDDGPDLPDECEDLAGTIDEDHVFYAEETGGFLHGSVENDLIYGSPADDHIDASGGDDCIVDPGGNNHLEGEDGNDVIVSGDGNDLIEAGSGNDVVYAGGGNDEIEAGSGNDLVYAGAGDDFVDAGSGDDEVYGEAGEDEIVGKGGNDTIYGGAEDDELTGGSGNDLLYGEEGDDTLGGGSGDDYLDGGPGADGLTGGSDTDTCVAGELLASCEP
jgi:Ca2+-binding RTX toxin-like protein